MGILDAVKQTIGDLTDENERHRQREQQEAEQKGLADERQASEKRVAEALNNKPALDRQQAEHDRRVQPGPAERLLAAPLIQAVPQPNPQPQPDTSRVAERQELTPGLQRAPSPGGANYTNPRAHRPAQVQAQESPAPEPAPPQARPQVEDLADLVKRRIEERREADQQRRNALTPEQQHAEDALKQLEQAKRGTVVRAYETGLGMTRTRE